MTERNRKAAGAARTTGAARVAAAGSRSVAADSVPPSAAPASAAPASAAVANAALAAPAAAGLPAAGAMPEWWPAARCALMAADPVLAPIARAHGAFHLASRGDPFQTLARSIVGQQISLAAAQTVWRRTLAAAGEITPARMAAMPADALRACGLSGRKVEYVRDLAARFACGELDPSQWPAMDDEAVIAALVRVRGVGRWTAEMFLMFNLLRPDVLPVDDVGLLRAIGLRYLDGARASRAQAVEIGERWRPWRTAACWYLWRSLEPIPVEY